MDEHLVPAARAGRVYWRDLDRAECGELVDALARRGESVALISDRIGCSERQVRKLRAEHRAAVASAP